MAGAPGAHHGRGTEQRSEGHDVHATHGARTPDDRVQGRMSHEISCSPTWAQPSADGSRVYVACNKANEIVEVDVARWEMTRRLPAGPGVYNLAVTGDGTRLIASNKAGQSVSVFDLESGRELARIPTTRKVVHGVAVTPDDRYAFISVEGIGSEPGTVEIIDLRTMRTVATVDVGQQAGGIDVWKMTEAGGAR